MADTGISPQGAEKYMGRYPFLDIIGYLPVKKSLLADNPFLRIFQIYKRYRAIKKALLVDAFPIVAAGTFIRFVVSTNKGFPLLADT